MGAREQIVSMLDSPRCARELVERTGLPKKTVESAVARMAELRLVECVTPEGQQARLYRLSSRGRVLRGSALPAIQEPPLQEYAWIQAGLHRRSLLAGLTEPLVPKELRQRVLAKSPQMGMGHVWSTLRKFRERGIAKCDDGRWSLTDLGRQLQAFLG